VVARKRSQHLADRHVLPAQQELRRVPSLVGQGTGLVEELFVHQSNEAVEPLGHWGAPLRA